MDKGLARRRATLFIHVGEADGQARYLPVRLDGAAVFARDGVRQHPLQQIRHEAGCMLYLFEGRVDAAGRTYVEPGVFDRLADKDGVWTVHPDGRDRLCLGWDEDDEGLQTVIMWRPMRVTVHGNGRRGVRHMKVECA